jgi:uncharacterized protein YjbI with pentapeptide repeats
VSDAGTRESELSGPDTAMARRAIPDGVFDVLEAADGLGRVETILALIEGSHGTPLDLSARGTLRAVLDGIDLSRRSLEARVSGAEAPPWWDSEARAVSLRGVNLRGARLASAVLRGADLRGADLREAVLGAADLRGARLEEADLRGADLAGADLRGATLGNADLRGAMLEESRLSRAVLRFARVADAALESADLRRADLWGADLSGATLSGADLRCGVLREVVLREADLTGCLLRGSDLACADLTGATLAGADFRRAQATAARFAGAILRDARLEGLDLSTCDLSAAHLCGAALDGARIPVEKLGGMIGEEGAGEFTDARKGYLALERHFQDTGDPDAASWAFRRRRRMQKHEALRAARAAFAEGRYRQAAGSGFHYTSDQLVEWLCDYGESIPRVLLAMLGVYLMFTLVYGAIGGVVRTPTGGGTPGPTRNPLDVAIFSLLSMTSGNTPGGMEPRDDLVILLAGVQSLLGVALTGLLGFVVGNLVRR